jgi:hypothetical protein
MHDEWDWDREEIVDLDGGCEATGDPALDQTGYESPRRSWHPVRWDAVAQMQTPDHTAERQRRRREALERNRAETRQRVAQRKGENVTPVTSSQPISQPDLPPHVSQAIADGMPGRDLGWWRVDVDATGRAVWTRVAAPDASGARMTVEQTAAARPSQWHLVEPTEPSPGTWVW